MYLVIDIVSIEHHIFPRPVGVFENKQNAEKIASEMQDSHSWCGWRGIQRFHVLELPEPETIDFHFRKPEMKE